MDTAEQLGKDVGVRQACKALGVSRASLYRRQAASLPTAQTDPRRPPRGLSPQERQQVKDVLYSERHRDEIGRAHV